MDAQRNLRHVLSAARDVFAEQGYDAPMEEVARRARVGVGTVYRRFPSKEALVQHIADEETRVLTDRAWEALESEPEPWGALECFVRASAASGTGRLLPPELLTACAVGGPADRVPQQRGTEGAGSAQRSDARELLAVMERLVEGARSAGELRPDVLVGDVVLVIATIPPALGEARRQSVASARLLEILLQGLRPAAR
ncbi:TetR/AcrR family transcriptional regulator [Streptomyces sp. ACA25]|uniref:TetR/AcrR family transcriptional regulator n=1 Tax=Streptomyces sp. ACA25 TaxID=3022596 RepID=UPI003FA7DDFC